MTFTIAELLAKIRTAQAVMSRKNAHRLLFGQCEAVILDLITAREQEDHKKEPDLVLVQAKGGPLVHDIYMTRAVSATDKTAEP